MYVDLCTFKLVIYVCLFKKPLLLYQNSKGSSHNIALFFYYVTCEMMIDNLRACSPLSRRGTNGLATCILSTTPQLL